MAYTQDEISEHIKTMHLFRKLGAEEVEKIAALLQPVELPKGEVLFHQGDPATSLYIVFSGRVRVTQTFGKEVRQLASWVEGDYFGMEALLKNQRRRSG
jgi:CRP-like cAMP-binding protein